MKDKMINEHDLKKRGQVSERGMSEVIEDRLNGLLSRKGDVTGLAEKIRLLAEDRALLATLSDNTKSPSPSLNTRMNLRPVMPKSSMTRV